MAISIRSVLCGLAAVACVAFSSSAGEVTGSAWSVIPVPASIVADDGTFTFPEGRVRVCVRGIGADSALVEWMRRCPLGMDVVKPSSKADVVLTVGDKSRRDTPDESYRMAVTRRGVAIGAKSRVGAFYALQTLLQMTACGKVRTIDCCVVDDAPQFAYRGLHFDVSRHFRSVDFLLKQLDAMALLKLNRMHLHLTDAAGWRIAVDGLPRLADFAAWRPERLWQDWTKGGHRYCSADTPGAYGGVYTPADMRRVIDYAAERNIMVIPEIEMPGHSEEVLAAYPHLACDADSVPKSDFCAGKEATFEFLEKVIDEVIRIFPSPYIHIGGDEAGKAAWKKCPHCKRRMEAEGLSDYDELQSYFICRIARMVSEKGRKIIGWDEILEGGLAPGATVMSWRGTEGGLKAMKAGHDVIMTPGKYYYFDYTQDAPFREPVSIGGYSPLANTYTYNPADTALTAAELSHLLGVQGNLWTEYVADDSHAEYMYYPRAFAVAETGWSPAARKDYRRFRANAEALCSLLRSMGYNTFNLASEYGERPESLKPVEHIARGCKVVYNQPFSRLWPARGDSTLTDGECGGWTYSDRKWQCFTRNIDVTVDLGSVRDVHYVGATFMQAIGAWVYVPVSVEVLLSVDGSEFVSVGTAMGNVADDYARPLMVPYGVTCSRKARFVRLKAVRNPRGCLFTDEIIVN